VYARSNASGVAPLWRFASVVARTVGAWVNVSSDEAAAIRAEAEPL